MEENRVEGRGEKQARNYNIGGQAVLEGVMMRGRRAFAVAVRRPDGEIVIQGREISSLTKRFPFLGKFALRGLLIIVETVTLGIEALSFSAREAAGEEEEFGMKELTLSIFLAALLAAFLFILLPIGLSWTVRSYVGYSYLRSLLEGFLRLAIFLAYLFFVTRLKDIKRVFQYHGAEHKVVHAFEAGEELTPENAAKHSPLHMGCGTAFLLNALVLTIFIFAFIPKTSIVLRIVIQLALVPFIAGFTYEIIRLARTRENSRVFQIIMKPGLALQRLTAREPSLDQIEVAIAAVKKVLELEEMPAEE